MKLFRRVLPIILISFLIVSISSCSDDDDDDSSSNAPANNPTHSVTSSSLVGDWEITSLDYEGTSTTTVQGTSYTTHFSGVGKNFTYQITFSDNPNSYVANGGYTVDLTSTSQGNSATQEITVPYTSSTGTWTLSGDTLSVTDDSTRQTNSSAILRGGSSSFSIDYSGFAGQSMRGADVTISSGQVTYEKIQ